MSKLKRVSVVLFVLVQGIILSDWAWLRFIDEDNFCMRLITPMSQIVELSREVTDLCMSAMVTAHLVNKAEKERGDSCLFNYPPTDDEVQFINSVDE